MIVRALIFTIVTFAAGVAGGCGLTDVGKPLSVQLTVNPATASVGDTLSFQISGTGSFLSLLVIDFGEAGADDFEAGAGGQSSSRSTGHAYESAGTFRAVGTVVDSSGEMSDTVEVVIQGDE